MKTVTTTDPVHSQSELTLSTIRERVNRIKSGWSAETARERAEEGKRRRAELEQMMLGDLLAQSRSKCDFTLVG